MKNNFLAVLASCIVPTVLVSCADAPVTFSTQHDSKYKITYLLTDFEANNNRSAEGWYRNGDISGWHYMFDDAATKQDYIYPSAGQSEYCVTLSNEQPIVPEPPDCNILTGFQVNTENPFTQFGSTKSFHMHGRAHIAGAGFGTYLADYKSNIGDGSVNTDGTVNNRGRYPDNLNKLIRGIHNSFPPLFSPGRTKLNGTPYCSDDNDFSGIIDPAFFADTNVPSARYAVEGTRYTTGEIWVDENGMEQFELAYEHPDTLKEPRCLLEMGQKGFVMWATGNARVEVSLVMAEVAPLTDGGICDEEGGEKCWDFHTMVFHLDDQWREYHASWDEFVQEGWSPPTMLDPNKIMNIQIKVPGPKSGETNDFDVWIDQVGFYGGTEWEFVTEMSNPGA